MSSRKLALRMSTVSCAMGHGAQPAPERRTISPQKNWSPKKGQTRVGFAALSPAAVVPAPPWCTTAATLGSNQS